MLLANTIMDQLHAGLNSTPSTCSSYSVTQHPGHTYWLASDLGLKGKSLLQEFKFYRPAGHWPQIFKNNICFRRICAHAWVDVLEVIWAGHVCMFGHIYPVERAFRRDDACGEWDKPIVLGLKAALICGSGLFDAFQPLRLLSLLWYSERGEQLMMTLWDVHLWSQGIC